MYFTRNIHILYREIQLNTSIPIIQLKNNNNNSITTRRLINVTYVFIV